MMGFRRHGFDWLAALVVVGLLATGCTGLGELQREYNGDYRGPFLNRVAFPIGGIGAGMVCLEGTGAISHVSVRNVPQIYNEPHMYAAICVKGEPNAARVLEGQCPRWKTFGRPRTGNGASGSSLGLPRFRHATFKARFPFGTVKLGDPNIPLQVELTGWSPFIPGRSDDACLPVGALEYRFTNPTDRPLEAVFSYNSKNFMALNRNWNTHSVRSIKNGFVFHQAPAKGRPHEEGSFAIFTDNDATVVDHNWFQAGWFDSATLCWKTIQEGRMRANPPGRGRIRGASLYVPLTIQPGEERTVRLMFAWYVPDTNLRLGAPAKNPQECVPVAGCNPNPANKFHKPWYAARFKGIREVADYWRSNYAGLRRDTALFTKAFYDTTLPPEVTEAVAANLTILKSPTMLRQTDGRLWCWEGCCDGKGCCSGSCTHVWNYAQATCHLFPDLERTLRHTEFGESMNKAGHQTFRAALPIRPVAHGYHAASDGQLGGIMKVYREWRISGDLGWLRMLWPKVKQSLGYCIDSWDPRGRGVLEEPHHNTYDIEYWGPDGHCSSFYLGALAAAVQMGKALDDDVSRYEGLLAKGRKFLEEKLFNGEYFIQKVQTTGLNAKYNPIQSNHSGPGYQAEVDLLNKQGPKYQYGTGCLSDGVLGLWIARCCGLGGLLDPTMERSHLQSVHKYNLRHDLVDHPNPQRPTFAMGDEGGLLLCTWPHGGELAIPFVYSNEVWTGIEYQVASHLMMMGRVEEGLEVVRLCRDRYDGRIRNPFDEYECGHWYARALSSYGLIQGLTGVRYDAVDRTLYIDSRVGDDFRSFLSTASGFGTVGLKGGKPFVDMKMGKLDLRRVVVSGKEMSL